MGLGEDYVKKLEEQRKLREKLLKIKEQRRKQVVTGSATDSKSADSNLKEPNPSGSRSSEGGKGIEADSTVASGKNSKRKKVLRIVRDKSGNIISKKVWSIYFLYFDLLLVTSIKNAFWLNCINFYNSVILSNFITIKIFALVSWLCSTQFVQNGYALKISLILKE